MKCISDATPFNKSYVSRVTFLPVAALAAGFFIFRRALSTLFDGQPVDIDIGTNGVPISSETHKLITFDPGDSLLLSRSLERYPFVIADFNGEATFHINEDEPGCSSLNRRNENYNQTLHDNQVKRRCPRAKFAGSRLFNCMHSRRMRQATVQVRQLSSFLKARRITNINKLKIDAQGTDFVIVKDLFENADHVVVNMLQLECQDYGKSVPLYFTSNECSDIIQYVKRKKPSMTHRLVENNCMAAEYNLIFATGGEA